MEESLKGYFWTAEDPNLKHFGEIVVSTKEKKQQITIYGSFPEFERQHLDINFHDDIPCLYGFTKERRYITLIGLRIEYTSGSFGNDTEKSSFKAEYKLSFRQLIAGPAKFEADKKFNKVSISAQFLGGWTKSNSIRQKPISTKPAKKTPSEIYELHRTDPISFSFESGTCLFYDYISSQHRFDINHLDIQQKTCFDFQFNQAMSVEELYLFLQKFREFYTLLTGVNLGLGPITLSDGVGLDFHYEYDRNIFNASYTSIGSDMRIMSLKTLAASDYLNRFFHSYDHFRLPLSHLMTYLNSDRSDYISYIQPFVSAMETIYNKSFRIIDENVKTINPTLVEILDKYQLLPKHRQFLTNAKLAKPYRDLHLKDKLVRIINHSPKLIELVDDPEVFVRKILDLRHYLVHEVDKAHTDLSLLNNRILLGKHIVKMKVVIEYHLLLLMGIDPAIVEEKIDRTFPNFVHFKRF